MMFPFGKNPGVLGLNARNLLYIKPFNPKKAVAFADDKIKTKAFLSARGIPTAKVFARIESRRQLRDFDFRTLPDDCVLKPNYGFGGEGIKIFRGRNKNGQFLEQGKHPVGGEELREHIEDILDGKFSVNGRSDTAFFEQVLVADNCFAPFRSAGLPDIRVVVFNLVPVMAMLRVPTAQSGGKANVHLGGIGIGIDIAKGVTTHAAQYHHMLKQLPHGSPVSGIQIPDWQEMLLICSRIQHITNIGYLAVDLTIDQTLGPVLLEVNARAGLMVQVANLAPLRSRLERVEGLKVSSPEKGVRIAQELFGEKVSRREPETRKPILAHKEMLEFAGESFIMEELAVVSPEREHTVFSADLLDELRSKGLLDPVGGSRSTYKVKFNLGGIKIQTLVKFADTPLHGMRAAIGRRDLAGFLIDPARKESQGVPTTAIKHDLRASDRLLAAMDGKLRLLKQLRPVNLREEIERLKHDSSYNPVFLMPAPSFDIVEAEESLQKINTDSSPLGILLTKKKRELLLRLEMIKARGKSDKFTATSLTLFGSPSTALIGFATAALKDRKACEVSPPAKNLLTHENVKKIMEKQLLAYGLHDWQVVTKANMVAGCAVGGKKVFIREGALFTKERTDALIAHEIETHVLTAENGRNQPYRIFRCGFGNYLDTQEGLAIFNQIQVLPQHNEKRYTHAKSVLAVAYAMEHSFAETRRYLEEHLGYQAEHALMKTLDLKRGISQTEEPGAFTKALVYFRGYRAIEHFLREGGDITRLYIGKIAMEDLALIDRIPGVRPALILPFSLRTFAVNKKRARSI